jgi:hypothetical protein
MPSPFSIMASRAGFMSSGELPPLPSWWVPLGFFPDRAKDLSKIASFPSISPCLYLLEWWSPGLSR